MRDLLRDWAWQRRHTLVPVVAGALLFLPGLGSRDLWNPDEPRYAEVAREMVDSGEYFVPYLNGEVYSQKPPLLFWAIALAGRLRGGIDETAARLPSALAAIAALVLVLRLGVRLVGERAGWFALAAFATCSKILWQGRIGQIDMLLVALVTLGVWFWVRAETEARPRLVLLFYVAAGLATLAKGPVGLLPPLLSILAYLGLRRDRAGLRRLRVGTGLVIWAGIVLLWLLPAGLHGGEEYLRQIVLRQNLTRYADPWHHFQPFHYYLTVLPADFFPWSLLLPGALVAAWRGRRDERRGGLLFAACWVAVTLLFFSLSPAKRTVYILTLYPGLALLAGLGLDRLERAAAERPRRRGWVAWPLGAFALVFGAAAAAVPRLAQRRAAEVEPLGPGFPRDLALLAAGLALAFAVAAWLGRRRIAAAAAALATGMAAAAIAATLWLLPRFDAVKSARPLAEVMLRHLRPGERFGVYPRLDATFLFYTRHRAATFASEAELRAFAASPQRVWLVAQRDDLAKLSPPLSLVEVARDPDVEEGYILLTTPPPPGG
jgi:4-amino-4-deoxy-L-arabinose transferase-like glycosyltransferase